MQLRHQFAAVAGRAAESNFVGSFCPFSSRSFLRYGSCGPLSCADIAQKTSFLLNARSGLAHRANHRRPLLTSRPALLAGAGSVCALDYRRTNHLGFRNLCSPHWTASDLTRARGKISARLKILDSRLDKGELMTEVFLASDPLHCPTKPFLPFAFDRILRRATARCILSSDASSQMTRFWSN